MTTVLNPMDQEADHVSFTVCTPIDILCFLVNQWFLNFFGHTPPLNILKNMVDLVELAFGAAL